MLTITEKIPDFITYEDELGYRGESALFFDIETTGLSAAASIVFLIGTIKKFGDNWQLTQWLAQCPEDEPLLLQAFFDATADCDTLIHFNGSTFDLPFIKERTRLLSNTKLPDSGYPHDSKMQSSECSLDSINSLDLYRKFRALKQPLGLSRMNQTTLEQFLGWPREDRLSGKQMISLFQKYTASQEPLLRGLLLLHNHDDLLGMTNLLCLCAYSMLLEGQFAAVSASLGYADPHSGIGHSADIADGSLLSGNTANEKNTRSCMKLCLTLKAALPRDITLSIPCAFPLDRADRKIGTSADSPSDGGIFSDPASCPTPDMSCTLTASGTQAILSVPGFRGELRHFFPNYRDYYYLPLEDQVIHKSVGAFVDKEYRAPATPANCCIKKSGLFFPQPEEIFSPAFKASCDSRELFFACPEQPNIAQSAIFPDQENTAQSDQLPELCKGLTVSMQPDTKTTLPMDLDQEKLAAYAVSLLRRFAHNS